MAMQFFKTILLKNPTVAILGACLCTLVLITSTTNSLATLKDMNQMKNEILAFSDTYNTISHQAAPTTTAVDNISRAINNVKQKLKSGLLAEDGHLSWKCRSAYYLNELTRNMLYPY